MLETTKEEPALTVEREILRVNLDKKSVESTKDEIIVESRTELYVDDECYAIFFSSPFQIKELIIGHLITEGIIEKLQDILSLEISEGKACVHLSKKLEMSSARKPRFMLTSCESGAGKIPPQLLKKIMKAKKASNIRFSNHVVSKAVETLNSLSLLFRKTGGTHASALLDEDGKMMVFAEDIGRHNAVDKVIGRAALEGVDFSKTLLASTGRLTSEIVVKAAIVGMPAIISLSAPTDKGIKIAEMAGLTLIGFARGRRFNIYTHPVKIQETS
ncbi:MAG: formate dehydrogenase accessory sulfurtransferase FdhD [Candidatus Bathyarchaeia archaeon]